MTETLDVLKIVSERLKADGFDGLVNGDMECACEVGGLAPCGELRGDCKAGHLGPCEPPDCYAEGDCGFHIVAWRKP